jgi:CheY-like chemotaxis protein
MFGAEDGEALISGSARPLLAAADGRLVRPSPPRTAMVVDSQNLVRLVVATYLRNLDYLTCVADGRASALERFSRVGPLDLLVTDVLLPGTTGCELAAHLRGHCPELDVIFMSAAPESERHLISPGFETERLLVKPFTSTALAAALARRADL